MVVEERHETRLKDFGINIKTKFKDGDRILERNTDHSKDDNVESGIILEKDYYRNGLLLRKENLFDSRMIYSYVFPKDSEFVCKNCGNKSKLSDFQISCPYCHTSYNMEYKKKELGSKHYYDLTIKSKRYIITTYIIDFIISFIITAVYILDTSRTFYLFDMLKILVGAVLISFILFYVFYYLDALIILPGIKKYKESINKKQEKFFDEMNYNEDDKTKFFNNINYALRQYYYSDREKNVIDYDIIDYNSFKKDIDNNITYVEVNMDIRVVSFVNNKINSSRSNITYRFKKIDKSKELKEGVNLIECPNCGSSIKVTSEKCDYCGTEIDSYQEWYLDTVID